MEILRKLRTKKELKQQEVAEALGVSRQAYANYETGSREPDMKTLQALAKFYEVPIGYLYEENTLTDIEQFPNLSQITKRRFPLLGEIACGEPLFANEDRESYVMASTDIKADFCLKAKGDSMMNARILDGDIVFIRQQPMVNNGEIAAVIIDNEATLKRVFYYPEQNKLVLNPENSKYEPLVYVGEELNDIRIIGKAIAFQSDVI